MRWIPTLTINQRLAALALTLGVFAIFARPMPGGAVSINPAELAAIVQTEVDHVAPLDLADWIVAGRADYRLVDLREGRAYGEYHVPGAENIPITGLTEAPLARNERIVLYSDGGIHAAQAWFLLRAGGFKGVYILRGGLDAWRDEVLFPVLAEHPTPFQAQRNDKLASLARHFGGRPRSGDAASARSPVIAMLKVEAPAGGSAVPAPTKKKKEGC